jgi:hypothetical protein
MPNDTYARNIMASTLENDELRVKQILWARRAYHHQSKGTMPLAVIGISQKRRGLSEEITDTAASSTDVI